ncbi:alpha/beta hydrolase [Brooklawnia cerclae]|uniref:Serine hydrolase family protein n=1 Tax=Brooklawnia cerclae TaxID=349934 RepID=A0ABX0SK44_9ACTN|nr:hypothetical protein [Brooklawnia cerclae]
MSIERVIVFHGYQASPSDHWFGWLADELATTGASVRIPTMPNSDDPDRESWVAQAAREIGAPDEHTAIVTHSLGGVTALHALDRIDGDWTLGAFIAVAGFVQPLPELPPLDAFTVRAPDVHRTTSRTVYRRVLLSADDPFVPVDHALTLARLLDAETTTFPSAGHFLGRDGFTRLPHVLAQLRARA